MSLGLMVPLIIGLILIFVIIALALRFMLRGHIDLAMKRVQKLNEDNLRRELELKRKLDEAENEYQRKLAEASKDALKLREESQQTIQEMKEKTLTEVNRERTEIIADARIEAERLKSLVLKEMEEKTLTRANELLKSVLTEQLTADMHAHFVAQVMDELAHEKRKLETETDTAELISAYPLTDDQKNRLGHILSEKTGKKIKLREKVDATHNIAGLYIKLGSLVIDGTLSQRLHQVLKQAKENLKT